MSSSHEWPQQPGGSADNSCHSTSRLSGQQATHGYTSNTMEHSPPLFQDSLIGGVEEDQGEDLDPNTGHHGNVHRQSHFSNFSLNPTSLPHSMEESYGKEQVDHQRLFGGDTSSDDPALSSQGELGSNPDIYDGQGVYNSYEQSVFTDQTYAHQPSQGSGNDSFYQSSIAGPEGQDIQDPYLSWMILPPGVFPSDASTIIPSDLTPPSYQGNGQQPRFGISNFQSPSGHPSIQHTTYESQSSVASQVPTNPTDNSLSHALCMLTKDTEGSSSAVALTRPHFHETPLSTSESYPQRSTQAPKKGKRRKLDDYDTPGRSSRIRRILPVGNVPSSPSITDPSQRSTCEAGSAQSHQWTLADFSRTLTEFKAVDKCDVCGETTQCPEGMDSPSGNIFGWTNHEDSVVAMWVCPEVKCFQEGLRTFKALGLTDSSPGFGCRKCHTILRAGMRKWDRPHITLHTNTFAGYCFAPCRPDGVSADTSISDLMKSRRESTNDVAMHCVNFDRTDTQFRALTTCDSCGKATESSPRIPENKTRDVEVTRARAWCCGDYICDNNCRTELVKRTGWTPRKASEAVYQPCGHCKKTTHPAKRLRGGLSQKSPVPSKFMPTFCSVDCKNALIQAARPSSNSGGLSMRSPTVAGEASS